MSYIYARWHSSICEINESHWKNIVGEKVIPFFNREWLSLLETSQSISSFQGWQPCHLALWRGETPISFAPLYLKNHSFGEFVFDQPFARLANQIGLRYYPKLVGMSPLSPVQGYRFFITKGEDQLYITNVMLDAIDKFSKSNNILSCNFLYVDKEWGKTLEELGWIMWLNQQSIWFRNEKKNFDDYLKMFNSNQRRNIKRERKSIVKSGLKVTPLSGSDLDLDLMQIMYDFYEQHCSRWGIWGSKYLSQNFFEALAETSLRDNIVVFSAHRGDSHSPVAMSLCVTDGKDLWGRYWGAKEDIPCLHFEVCYYAPIEWALLHGIKSFDPGAGGSHKHRRGFRMAPRASLHHWYQSDYETLLSSWVTKVNSLILNEIDSLNAELPFEL